MCVRSGGLLSTKIVGLRTGTRYISKTGIVRSIDISDRTFVYRTQYRTSEQSTFHSITNARIEVIQVAIEVSLMRVFKQC